MQDEVIISLYFKRAEEAITATKDKYGRLLVSLAYGILQNTEDAKECENDTYLKTWMSIPPQKPAFLRAFLAKITRNLALDCYEAKQAQNVAGENYQSFWTNWLKSYQIRQAFQCPET